MIDLSETFWITFTTMGFAFLSGALAYALKSKCTRVKCFGLEIIRDIDAELEEGSVALPGNVIEPVPERRASVRSDSGINAKVAEAMSRYQSIQALNQSSRPITRSNSFA